MLRPPNPVAGATALRCAVVADDPADAILAEPASRELGRDRRGRQYPPADRVPGRPGGPGAPGTVSSPKNRPHGDSDRLGAGCAESEAAGHGIDLAICDQQPLSGHPRRTVYERPRAVLRPPASRKEPRHFVAVTRGLKRRATPTGSLRTASDSMVNGIAPQTPLPPNAAAFVLLAASARTGLIAPDFSSATCISPAALPIHNQVFHVLIESPLALQLPRKPK